MSKPKPTSTTDIYKQEQTLVDKLNSGLRFQDNSTKVSLQIEMLRRHMTSPYADALFVNDSYNAYTRNAPEYDQLLEHEVDVIFAQWKSEKTNELQLPNEDPLPAHLRTWRVNSTHQLSVDTRNDLERLFYQESYNLVRPELNEDIERVLTLLDARYPKSIAHDSSLTNISLSGLSNADWVKHCETYAGFLYTFFDLESQECPALAMWPQLKKIYSFTAHPNKLRALTLLAYHYYESVSCTDVTELKSQFNRVSLDVHWYAHVFVEQLLAFQTRANQLNADEASIRFNDSIIALEAHEELCRLCANPADHERYSQSLLYWCKLYATRSGNN